MINFLKYVNCLIILSLLSSAKYSFSQHLADEKNVVLAEDLMKKFEVADQETDATCYSFAALQLEEFEKSLKKYSHQTLSSDIELDAIGLALIHKKNNFDKLGSDPTQIRRWISNTPDSIGRSQIQLALADSMLLGRCNLEMTRLSLKSWRGNLDISDQTLVLLFQNLYHSPISKVGICNAIVNTLNKTYVEFENTKIYLDKISNLKQEFLGCVTKKDSDFSVNANQFISHVLQLQKKYENGLEFLISEVLPGCSKSNLVRSPMKFQIEQDNEYFSTDDNIEDTIDASLSASVPRPIAVGHCWNFYNSKPNQFKISFSNDLGFTLIPRVAQLLDSNFADACDPHYALIVGKRMNGASKEYLIRNSSGPRYFAKYRTCLCHYLKDNTTAYCNFDFNLKPTEVEVRGCYFSAEELLPTVFSTTTLR